MKHRLVPAAAVSALLLAGCIARMPADADTLPAAGSPGTADPAVTVEPVPPDTAVPYDIYAADMAEESSREAAKNSEYQTIVLAMTGGNPTIDEAYPADSRWFSRLPETILWGEHEYTRTTIYLPDSFCEQQKEKGEYIFYAEGTEGLYECRDKIAVCSVEGFDTAACIATNFGKFADGVLLVYVNGSEWTDEMTATLTAAVQTS